MAITDWPADERPREKLIQKGVEALSHAELLAIFLRVGVVGKSAVDLARDFLSLRLGASPREIFMVLFLDAQNRIHAQENLFEGTLTQTSVYPREVVKRALFHNAASVIFAHNHPNGAAEASQADKQLTQALKTL